jgi:ribosomal protein S18 acetylase RimI-like enzyme
MSDFTLRTLTIADYDAVYALWQQTEGIGLNDSDTREAIAAFLDHNPNLSQVACNEAGQIVGTVLCGHDGRRGYLHHLAVNRADRKRGIGRSLVNECLNKLAGLKIQKCNLFLFANNTPGRTFWLHQGWTAREDIVLVQKELKPGKSCGCSC